VVTRHRDCGQPVATWSCGGRATTHRVFRGRGNRIRAQAPAWTDLPNSQTVMAPRL